MAAGGWGEAKGKMAGHDPFEEGAKMMMRNDGHALGFGDMPSASLGPPAPMVPGFPAPNYTTNDMQQHMQQQYAAAAQQRGFPAHPPQMMMPPQPDGSAHYRLTRQRSMGDPDPFLAASTSQGGVAPQQVMMMAAHGPRGGAQPPQQPQRQQRHAGSGSSAQLQAAISQICKTNPLPEPEVIEQTLRTQTVFNGVGGPSFQQIKEFYAAAPKYDVAYCSLKLMGAYLQHDPKERPRLEKLHRLSQTYKKGLEQLKKEGKPGEAIKALQEKTIKIMKDSVLGPDRFEKIQIGYTGYFMKLVLYEMDGSHRQRGSQIHLKCIALYANIGVAFVKNRREYHYKVQAQALKALHQMVGHQTFEYLWRRAIYVLFYLKGKEDENKKAMEHYHQQQMQQRGMGYPGQGYYQGMPPGMMPAQQPQGAAQGASPASQQGAKGKGRKRKAAGDASPEDQDAAGGAKKPKKAPAAAKGARGKQTAAAKRKTAQQQQQQAAAAGQQDLGGPRATGGRPPTPTQRTQADLYVEGAEGIFTTEMKRRLQGSALRLFGLDFDQSAFEALEEGVENHLRSIVAKAAGVMSSRTVPFVKSGAVELTGDPRKEIAAIYRREYAATRAKENAEKAALLKEGERSKKSKKKDMDEDKKEKLDRLIQEEDKKKLANDANEATMAVLGVGTKSKWSSAKKAQAKPSQGSSQQQQQNASAAGEAAKMVKSGSLLDQSSLLKRFMGASGGVESREVTAQDILLVLKRDWRYKDSKWLMHLEHEEQE